MLIWSTGAQTNGIYFGIQRSNDGSTWSTISQVAAYQSVSNPQNYSYTDYKPASGINYYRLKIIDDNGNSAYSNIRNVDFNTSQSLQAWPNPVKDEATITGLSAGSNNMRLFDVNGKTVAEQVSTGSSAHINIGSLPGGVYILRVQSANGSSREIKVVKQ